MKIGIFTPLLMAPTPGGAERAVCGLANYLYERSHTVHMYYGKIQNNKPYYPLDSNIPCHLFPNLSDLSGIAGARAMLLSHGIDILCGFLWDHSAELCMHIIHDTAIAFLYSERSEPEYILSKYWPANRHAVYTSMMDGIVLLCNKFRKYYPSSLQNKITVIPNAIKKPAMQADLNGEANRPKRLLAVGRVDESKQFHLLLQAFSGLADFFPDWELRICGDGPQLQLCRDLSQVLGIKHKVVFTGAVKNIDAEYAAAQVFCLPSRSEGFPNVVGEAMRHGLSTVGFAACAGVNDLIAHGKNGLLAHEMTAESLAAALFPLLQNASLRQLMGKNAEEMSCKFDPENVYPLWEDVLFRAIASKKTTKC